MASTASAIDRNRARSATASAVAWPASAIDMAASLIPSNGVPSVSPTRGTLLIDSPAEVMLPARSVAPSAIASPGAARFMISSCRRTATQIHSTDHATSHASPTT